MKYCVDCKLRGKNNETACSRCGRPFRTLGRRHSRPTQPRPELPKPSTASNEQDVLHLELEGRRHRLLRSARRVRWLAALAAMMLLAFGAALLYFRYSYVMQYAEVDQLTVSRAQSQPEAVSIHYRPLTRGKIEFVRTTDHRIETLVEYSPPIIAEMQRRHFRWSDSDGQPATVTVRHRNGWRVVSHRAYDSTDAH